MRSPPGNKTTSEVLDDEIRSKNQKLTKDPARPATRRSIRFWDSASQWAQSANEARQEQETWAHAHGFA
jgi:hypothetical protein